MLHICFVCLGNICRSPTAEGIFRDLVQRAGLHSKIKIDSAGLGDWHAGELPDPRSTQIAAKHGIALDSKARQIKPQDFTRFDYLVALDKSVLHALVKMKKPNDSSHIVLMRQFDPSAPKDADVPDPYSMNLSAFEEVFLQCERACAGLLRELRQKHRI
jgi:protein-tyrosine phosphatase